MGTTTSRHWPSRQREARRAGAALALVTPIVGLAGLADRTAGTSWLGLGLPLVIRIGFMLLGRVVLRPKRWREPEFFVLRREVAEPAVLLGGDSFPAGVAG